ncbi:MAG: 2OG-Fe(II) oxygenase [Acidimicrobiales bacterium]
MISPNAVALDRIVDLDRFPLGDSAFGDRAKAKLASDGLVVLDGFIRPVALAELVVEAKTLRPQAFFSEQRHSVYLEEPQPELAAEDARSWAITSTKGAITTDQIPAHSHLRTIYDSPRFRQFLCQAFGEQELFEYADPLSSININYYEQGQELGWHFDNSSFSITLLTQRCEAGGEFESIPKMRDSAAGDDNYRGVAKLLADSGHPSKLVQNQGDLVLFRGRDTFHRVTPVEGDRARILTVFAYNTEPEISLSENARKTFFGRQG